MQVLFFEVIFSVAKYNLATTKTQNEPDNQPLVILPVEISTRVEKWDLVQQIAVIFPEIFICISATVFQQPKVNQDLYSISIHILVKSNHAPNHQLPLLLNKNKM